jgi:site-specific DNA-cytosine methylase
LQISAAKNIGKELRYITMSKKSQKKDSRQMELNFPKSSQGASPVNRFSVAGKQKGTSDDRHLWPEMFRIIKEFKPRWVIGENVKGITNIQDGMVFETVCTDLEGEGYEVRAFNIPAAGVGAPHRRERIWIVAHAKCFNDSESIGESDGAQDQVQKEHRQNDSASREFSRTSEVWKKKVTDMKNVEDSRRTLRQGAELGKRECKMKLNKKMPISINDQVAHPNLMWPNTETQGIGRTQSTKVPPSVGKTRGTYTRNESSRGQTNKKQMWPTPRAAIGMTMKLSQGMANLRHKKYLETEVAYQEKAPGGTLNPTWVEWLMGYPAEYTDLNHWETLSSPRSRKKSVKP